ncbi:MAG: diaminopropionate ammonia-lyase [Desulfuromonadales bacterium]|nr:diaminopropionate ammonia-lyase [Desulfuromonadales bacterium]
MIDAIFDKIQVDYFHNPHSNPKSTYPDRLQEVFDTVASQKAIEEICRWPGYSTTPLLSLDGLARELGIGGVYYKDEGGRFGLGSFKSLGGAYEVLCLLQREVSGRVGREVSFENIRNGNYAEIVKEITVVTATDGNHGRSVAWGAQLFGCRCVIYIHSGVSARRKTAMEEFGAKVVRINGNYDESVTMAAEAAATNNWFIVSDTSYEGYTDLPKHVMAGYTVMAAEIAGQLPKNLELTHTFVQGGVGGLAGALCGYLWQTLGSARPRFVVVEPNRADCLFQSAKNGKPTDIKITDETIMAGLSCGKVSYLGWQILSDGADDFMTIPDELIAPVMRLLAEGTYSPVPVVAGESAVAGLAALIVACRNPDLRSSLGLDKHSRILLIGTEGATDPDIYRSIVGRTAEEVRSSLNRHEVSVRLS